MEMSAWHIRNITTYKIDLKYLRSNDNPMSDIRLKHQLKIITVPVFIEIALVMLLGAVDTVMLSRYSDNSVAAVGLDNQLISLVFLVYQFFSMGAAILCAQYIGAGLHKRLVQVVGMALVVNLLLGLTVSAMLFFFAEDLLHLMGLRPELMGDGVVYLRLTGSLSFFQALSLTFSASLRSADKVVWPMVVTGIVNVLNIFGNYALIFGHWGCPQMGVEGAAIATANMIMFVYLFCVSITQGGNILVGHLVGQWRHQAAYLLGNYFFRLAMIVTVSGSILLALAGSAVLHAFTENEEIIRMGVWVLVVDIFLEIGRTSNIFAGSTLRATGDTVYPFVVGIIFQWSIAVGLSYIIGIPLGYGLVGMWIGFAIDENIRGVILLHRWRSGKWRSKGFVAKTQTA